MKKVILLIVIILTNFSVNAQDYPQMIFVEGGTFIMGETCEAYRDKKKEPKTKITLEGFKIAKTEITKAQWRTYKPENYNSDYYVDNEPATNIPWDEAIKYCEWLSKITGKVYRLPSESEWEYSARGGNKSKGYKYAGSNSIDDVCWYYYNSEILKYNRPQNSVHNVASKKPNELGLYDMSGNVSEWCYYHCSTQYRSNKISRGGNYSSSDNNCSVNWRVNEGLGGSDAGSGFRVVEVLSKNELELHMKELKKKPQNENNTTQSNIENGTLKNVEEKTEYYTNGAIFRKAHYINGVLNGKCINYKTEGGKNVPEEEGDYINGLKEGVWIIYEPIYGNDGNTLTGKYQVGRKEMYVNGKLNGLTYSYYQNGSVFEKKNYVNDESHGEWIRYHENGKVRSKSYYKNGNFIKEIIINIKP